MGAPGFDDAPPARLKADSHVKPITMVYPYYENPRFLRRQIEGWRKWPEDLRALTTLHLVDDGSPTVPAVSVLASIPQELLPFRTRLWRIDVDVRWNWLAARNIAMHHAAEGWCLMTDMDHVVTPAVASNLVAQAHDERCVYRFARRESNGRPIHPHPNSTFLTRAMFWRIGGYDERMSGYYGSDGYWRRRIVAAAKVWTLPDQLVRHEFDEDSSTSHYQRKQPEDAELRKIVRAFPPRSKPTHLTFPYHEVQL